MSTVIIEEAQAKLPEIIDNLPAGEEVVIVRDGRKWPNSRGPARSNGRARPAGTARRSSGSHRTSTPRLQTSRNTWNDLASRYAHVSLVLPGRSGVKLDREGWQSLSLEPPFAVASYCSELEDSGPARDSFVRTHVACSTAPGSISTRATSNPAACTSAIAERIASSNEAASRWK